jgi:two-component system sensor histidine kinase YesM
MGEINDTPEVCEVSHLLGKLLRYSLDHNDQVPLHDELDSVKDYLSIQKIRFEESLAYSFQIDGETKQRKVPKFILQPIVENCVVHGLSEDRPLLISISSVLDSENLILRLRDDGKGMTGDQLQGLQDALHKGERIIERSSHIGLHNVDKRLRTRFGDEYGLKIDSVEGVFTEVVYTIPLNGKGIS